MKREVLKGKIQGNERGYAFLIREDGGNDIFIPHGELRGAMHADVVLCERVIRGGERPSARVLKIIERGTKSVVGTFFSCKTGGFVRPDDSRFFNDVTIALSNQGDAQPGDKVVCEIVRYKKSQNPEGRIVCVFGRQFDRNAELQSIIYSFGVAEQFSEQTLKQIKSIKKPNESDFKEREDLRSQRTFTIDGEDARDFDDAVSISKQDDGYVLGVHIADVSHYVKAGSPLDKDAFTRGTSVYFPEKVIPMLPEKLCNDLCSLVEGKDRLTLSCIMKIDYSGKVTGSRITPSVINSHARLTYTQAQRVFDGDVAEIQKLNDVANDLIIMRELAQILIDKREKNGCIDLDVKESAIYVNKGGLIEVSPVRRDMAHRVIEEFMILANCTVAEYASNLNVPFVYRVHERPSPEKLLDFYEFLNGLGINVCQKENVHPSDFNNILKAAEGSGAFALVNKVMLRSMQKAVYDDLPKGHFGLGEEHYCHFTSPIRRYPDLVVHRILKDILTKGAAGLEQRYGEFVKQAARQASATERNADSAERAVDEYYKILYISRFEGQEFDGFISGVTNFGLFVELENGVEGLVKIDTLSGNRYVCDRGNYTLSNGRHTYRLGERLRITVAGVSLFSRRVEFLIVEDGVKPVLKSKNRARNGKKIKLRR